MLSLKPHCNAKTPWQTVIPNATLSELSSRDMLYTVYYNGYMDNRCSLEVAPSLLRGTCADRNMKSATADPFMNNLEPGSFWLQFFVNHQP